MLDFKEVIQEKKEIRIDSAKFVCHSYGDWSIIFLPASAADLDVVNMMKTEYRDKILKHLNAKTKFDWHFNTAYKGAGYCFKLNKYAFVEYINKKIS